MFCMPSSCGQSPLDRDAQVWHAAVRVERFGREPGPENHACAVGVPGGHTQREGVTGELHPAVDVGRLAKHWDAVECGGVGEKQSAVDTTLVSCGFQSESF